MNIEQPSSTEAVNPKEQLKKEITQSFEGLFGDLGIIESARMLEIRTIDVSAMNPEERGTLESEYRILAREQIGTAPSQKQSDVAVGVNMACAAVIFVYGDYQYAITHLEENLEQAEYDPDVTAGTVGRIDKLIDSIYEFIA